MKTLTSIVLPSAAARLDAARAPHPRDRSADRWSSRRPARPPMNSRFRSRTTKGATFGITRSSVAELVATLALPALARQGLTPSAPLSDEAVSARVTDDLMTNEALEIFCAGRGDARFSARAQPHARRAAHGRARSVAPERPRGQRRSLRAARARDRRAPARRRGRLRDDARDGDDRTAIESRFARRQDGVASRHRDRIEIGSGIHQGADRRRQESSIATIPSGDTSTLEHLGIARTRCTSLHPRAPDALADGCSSICSPTRRRPRARTTTPSFCFQRPAKGARRSRLPAASCRKPRAACRSIRWPSCCARRRPISACSNTRSIAPAFPRGFIAARVAPIRRAARCSRCSRARTRSCRRGDSPNTSRSARCRSTKPAMPTSGRRRPTRSSKPCCRSTSAPRIVQPEEEATAQIARGESDRDLAGTLRAPWRWEDLIVEAAVIGQLDRWQRRLQGPRARIRSPRSRSELGGSGRLARPRADARSRTAARACDRLPSRSSRRWPTGRRRNRGATG